MNQSKGSEEKRIEIKRKIDELCDWLESRWRSGQAPDIAELVNDLDSSVVPGFLSEILQMEMEINGRSQHELRAEYVAQLPEHHQLIEATLDSLFRVALEFENRRETLLMDKNQRNAGDDFTGKKIGDYLIKKKIAAGGFGVVYLADDTLLRRDVVIKIPRSRNFLRPQHIDFFLDEARNVALLNHEYILRVLHVGMDSGLPYIVQEYFEGGDLRQALEKNAYSIESTVELVRKVAEAISFAHQFRIIHRDLKPANILIKSNGDPVVADFGLALRDPQLCGKAGEIAGTIHFMSPEQMRGEAHRLDGRTDIWSIGVILYLMLVGRLPFQGEGPKEVGDAILFGRPCPPRQLNDNVSKELDRICLKCLQLRVHDRYSTALDLADELESLNHLSADQQPPVADSDEAVKKEVSVSVVPKGLTAFDSNDSEFFLDLLPGPLDREGLPESIHFWKNRIEDPLRSHPVGLIYGPSGCGKSSLVSAGLLPRLAKDILVVHVESTPDDTEVRLLKGLRGQIPAIPDDLSLPDVIAGIRRRQWLPPDRRVLIVFDQFEQWLHANTINEHTQLIDALRQCDGQTVQALILARDDFWMAISRFFRQLEMELVERKNFASVDLFSKRHAKDVAIKFGQAYGNLPENGLAITERQDRFLDQAIDLVAENESVNCVRLALFVETAKNQPWEVETLRKIGDAKDIGIVFLEQVLGEAAPNPNYRYHRQSLLAVLESLLPDPGVEIKGNLCSRKELADAAQLDSNGPDFESVLNILDSELRLITPTEPDAGRYQNQTGVLSESYYQLTHDYLVPSLREWMHSVRGQTRRGRARIQLQELTAAWRLTGHQRFLPGFFEYCSIGWNVPSSQRNEVENQFMGRANRYFGLRAGVLFLLITTLIGCLWMSAAARQYDKTESIASRLLSSEAGAVAIIEEQLKSDPDNALKILNQSLNQHQSQLETARTYMGLAALEEFDSEGAKNLVEFARTCKDSECRNLLRALSKNLQVSCDALDDRLDKLDEGKYWTRLQILRAFLNPEDEAKREAFAFNDDPTLRTTVIHEFKNWHGDLTLLLKMLDSETSKSGMLEPSTDEATLSGLCLVAGQFDRSELEMKQIDGKSLFEQLNDKMIGYYQSHSKASVHGASRCALTIWTVELPLLGPSFQSDNARWVDNEWWVNSEEMTMVRVRAGIVPNKYRNTEQPDVVEHDFFIGSCEVTTKLFQRFLNDKRYPSDKKPIGWERDDNTSISIDSAVNAINQEDAILFCNWLSEQDRRKPCYRKINDKEIPDDEVNRANQNSIGEWERVPGADGYRLPENEEWELAARAGCTTNYYYSNNPDYLRSMDYVWYEINSFEDGIAVVHPVGFKIPNRFGLFDVMGNVYEICWSFPPRSPQRNWPDVKEIYMSRGGGNDSAISWMPFDPPRWATKVWRRDKNKGFRVAMDASD